MIVDNRTRDQCWTRNRISLIKENDKTARDGEYSRQESGCLEFSDYRTQARRRRTTTGERSATASLGTINHS